MAHLVVQSRDGSLISSEIYGTGRPLVIVSGALFASELWRRAVLLVSRDRAVYVLDRRGRGKSQDREPYSPEREIEDILSVLAALPGPVDLLGHSSGAILALQAAEREPVGLSRLIVYEPPVFFAEEDRIAADLAERLDALLSRGQAEAAVETFFREGPRTPESELQAMKRGTGWKQMLDSLAHTVPRDARVQRAFSGDAASLSRVHAPTLMLVGGASPERMRRAAETIQKRLPRARLRELQGQQHTAMLNDPASFAEAVNDFLSTTQGSEESAFTSSERGPGTDSRNDTGNFE